MLVKIIANVSLAFGFSFRGKTLRTMWFVCLASMLLCCVVSL